MAFIFCAHSCSKKGKPFIPTAKKPTVWQGSYEISMETNGLASELEEARIFDFLNCIHIIIYIGTYQIFNFM